MAAANQNQGRTPESDDVPEKVATSGWISATIGTVLLLLCVFLIAKEMEERQKQARFNHAVSRQISDVRQLILACRTYAADYGDAFPDELQQLLDENYLDMPEILQTRHTASGASEPYIYRQGCFATHPPRTPLIISPESPETGTRVIGYIGGSVATKNISDEEVERLLAEDPASLD